MDNINLHILSPNKYQKRYFGVDYFMGILKGSNPLFKYYSTPIDQNPVFNDGPISFLDEMYEFLEYEISKKEPGSIIGIESNPDVYDGVESINRILEILKKYSMGLYIETSSIKILKDLDALKAFAEELPLLLAIPVANISVKSRLLGESLNLDSTLKIIPKLANFGLNVGVIVKPIIPMINDDLESFTKIINQTIAAGVKFVYPSFSLKFDSKKLKAFYDIIDMEFPMNMVKYQEMFGHKTTWESKTVPNLKKNYVILCKKHKVLYSMKDIINSYKPDLNIQLKLF